MLTLLLKAPGLRFFSRIEEQNCLAMLVFCTILWATEVIPLFVTSLMVPLLVVTLRVARTDDIEDRRMTAPETTKWIFSQMFAPNMCLLLGGFTLAAALSKYSIDKLLAQKVLRLAGTRPATVLLAHMAVACFASMWISNVAAPVLMYSLIQPILRNLPSKSPFASALIMGIALASNIGGQTSPIASPQNLIALQYMDDEPLGWLQWFAITIPVSGLSLIIIWLLLLWSYGSGRGTVIKRVGESRDSFTGIQYFISAVALATIVLWCLERNFEHIVGDMGVIAILPMILFFGTGILTKEDFNNFLWTIVFLAMGGIALGKAVTSSGLLASLDELIQELVKACPSGRSCVPSWPSASSSPPLSRTLLRPCSSCPSPLKLETASRSRTRGFSSWPQSSQPRQRWACPSRASPTWPRRRRKTLRASATSESATSSASAFPRRSWPPLLQACLAMPSCPSLVCDPFFLLQYSTSTRLHTMALFSLSLFFELVMTRPSFHLAGPGVCLLVV
ncbi:hypothetical protein L7F22_021614 [Adiantum nelumboides]|nr:hypothetical protein [Adiantum nelumboides]